MALIGEHIDYKNDWIVDSGYSNHMADNQSGAMEAGGLGEESITILGQH